MKISGWKPQELLFYVATLEGETLITICPKYWFEREGFCYDGHLDLRGVLPDIVHPVPVMECTWESDHHSSHVIKALKDRGFVEDENFTMFMEEFL